MAKVVVITGASRGLGLGIAKYFAGKGWQVAATMRNPAHAPELEVLNNVKKYRLDVEDESTIATAQKDILADFGRVDVLVNNAGYGLFSLTETVALEAVRKQMEVNFVGTVAVTKAFLPTLRQQGSGTLVNITSIIGNVSVPFSTYYAASKYALEGFSECLAYELAPFGIRVRTVAPGAYQTDFPSNTDRPEEYPNATYADFVNKVNTAIADPDYYADPEQVPPTVYKAATHGGRHFKRYFVGKDAKLFAFVKRWFGGAVQRLMVRKYIKL